MRSGLRAAATAVACGLALLSTLVLVLACFLTTGLAGLRLAAPYLTDPDSLVRVVEAQSPGGLDEGAAGITEAGLVVDTRWASGSSAGCPTVSTTTWSTPERPFQTVELTRCTLARAAFALLEREVVARAADPGAHAWEAWRYETPGLVGRLWVEDSTLLRVETTCALTWDCDFWNDALVFDLVHGLPEGWISAPDDGDLATPAVRIWVALGIVLLALGLARAVALLRTELVPVVPAGPGWTDLTAPANRIVWLLRLRTAGTVVALTLVPLIGLLAIPGRSSASSSVGLVLVAVQGLAFGGLAVWANHVVGRELSGGRRPAVLVTGTLRTDLGRGLARTGRVIHGLGWIAAGLLVGLLALLGDGSPAPALAMTDGFSPAVLGELLTGTVAGFSGILTSSNGHLQLWAIALLAVAVLAPALLAGLALTRLGGRLLAPTIRQARAADPRPPLLLLRSFDEDGSRILSLVPPRSAVPAWLRPRRQRRFEEVLSQTLAGHGPLIAIAPPGGSLPSLGAAKESLSNDQWRDRVDELTAEADTVVFLATPESVNPGLQWELANTARHLGPDRILLVLGSYRAPEVARRWSGFAAAAAAANPALAGLGALTPTPGAQAIAWDGERWIQVGARRRSDVTYRLCLDEALRLQAWARWPLRRPPS